MEQVSSQGFRFFPVAPRSLEMVSRIHRTVQIFQMACSLACEYERKGSWDLVEFPFPFTCAHDEIMVYALRIAERMIPLYSTEEHWVRNSQDLQLSPDCCFLAQTSLGRILLGRGRDSHHWKVIIQPTMIPFEALVRLDWRSLPTYFVENKDSFSAESLCRGIADLHQPLDSAATITMLFLLPSLVNLRPLEGSDGQTILAIFLEYRRRLLRNCSPGDLQTHLKSLSAQATFADTADAISQIIKLEFGLNQAGAQEDVLRS